MTRIVGYCPFAAVMLAALVGSAGSARAQSDSVRRIGVSGIERRTSVVQGESSKVVTAVVQRGGERAPGPDSGLEQFVFPPDRVLQYQDRIGLTTEQRNAIRSAVRDMQARSLDLQWKLQDESDKLVDLLKRQAVNEAETLAQVDRVLTVEREVKRTQMGMLIKIKNTLTADQQDQLRKLRARDADSGRPWGSEESGGTR